MINIMREKNTPQSFKNNRPQISKTVLNQVSINNALYQIEENLFAIITACILLKEGAANVMEQNFLIMQFPFEPVDLLLSQHLSHSVMCVKELSSIH